MSETWSIHSVPGPRKEIVSVAAGVGAVGVERRPRSAATAGRAGTSAAA